MDIERARELLPWLLNGSLEEPERGELLTALRTSDELRRDLAETRLAGEIFGQHVAAAELVAHAFGESTGLDRGRIEAHLALCERCAEELAMARESHELAEEAEAGGEAPAPRPAVKERRRGWLLPFLRPAAASAGGGVAAGWQVAALAASLIALVGLGGWIWTWQQAQGRLADVVASVRESLPPQAGPVVADAALIPDVVRSGDGCTGPNCVRLEARFGVATLRVPSVIDVEGVYELRFRRQGGDGAGEPIRLRSVAPTPGSQLEFRAPANLLEAGEYEGELHRLGDRGWERVESYLFRVVVSGR